MFAKLPSAFKIDTPLGSYNPDWAYVEEADGERRVYFVTETKGGKNGEPALRDAEKIKIAAPRSTSRRWTSETTSITTCARPTNTRR